MRGSIPTIKPHFRKSEILAELHWPSSKLMSSHISDDLLERYSMGRLTEAEMAPLEEHLLVCEECRNRLVLTDVEIAAIREALKRREEKLEE